MYRLVRPFLFQLDPESAHNLTLRLLRLAGRLPPVRAVLARQYAVDDPRLEVEAFGLRFKNPVGLAAGYDKNGAAIAGLSSLGFGHVEIGTLTPAAQAGHPRPRVHRFPRASAVVNRMGFPNAGLSALGPDLSTGGQRGGAQLSTRVGVNLGKSKDTPLDEAAGEYSSMLRQVHARRQADYVTLNVSSPNTAGLRQLQGKQFLSGLLGAVAQSRNSLAPRLPILVKIAPDLDEREIDDVLEVLLETGLDGVIATNTTLSRAGLPEAADLAGGLSGRPLRERSTAVIRYVAARTEGKLPIIGVGGIDSAEAALEKLQCGAHLVQVYTGLVYTGPSLIHQINLGLLRACETAGVTHVGALSGQPQS